MKITYKITKDQQQRQILAGKNPEIEQTVDLPNADATEAIHRNNVSPSGYRHTWIFSDGEIAIDLTAPLPFISKAETIWAKDGSGRGSSEQEHAFDYLIQSVDDLANALVEVAIIAEERQVEAARRTQIEEENFPLCIAAYNEAAQKNDDE